MMKKLLFGLLLIPSLGFGSSLALSGSGSGQLTISVSTGSAGSGSSIYAATSTASFPFGLTASSVTISSNTVLPGTTFYQGTPLYHMVVDTASITQLYNQINAFRLPRLVYVSGTEVDLETGITGTLGSTPLIFPDGAVYNENQSTLLNMVLTSTANWGNLQSAGWRPTEKRTIGLWEGFYAVKSTGTTASLANNTTDYVIVVSSWQPTQANYSQLNTNFCGSGTNCWRYLGVLPYGDGTSASAARVFPKFTMSGNKIRFYNTSTGQNVSTVNGILMATTAGATSLTWTYATGSLLSSAQVPSQVTIGDVFVEESGSTRALITDAANTNNLFQISGLTSGNQEIPIANHALVEGVLASPSGSSATDIFLQGYQDNVLGVGGIPQL